MTDSVIKEGVTKAVDLPPEALAALQESELKKVNPLIGMAARRVVLEQTKKIEERHAGVQVVKGYVTEGFRHILNCTTSRRATQIHQAWIEKCTSK